MARADTNVTPNLRLPLRTTGSVAFAASFKAAMRLIDSLFSNGGQIDASNIPYLTDDSNSTAAETNVSAELDALRARVARLEGRTDSNSAG